MKGEIDRHTGEAFNSPEEATMRIRNGIAALIVGLVLAAAPAQALRMGAPAPGESIRTDSATTSGSWLSSGLHSFWSWFESIFDEDHGGIAP